MLGMRARTYLAGDSTPEGDAHMRGTNSRRWKPILVACVIAMLVVPAAAGAHMEWADQPVGYYADMPAIALQQQNARRAENDPRTTVPSAVHEVRTVKAAGSDNTLALALSAAALAVALGGAAYMVFRLSPRMVRARRPTAEA
jgi:hypothetical protein